MWWVGELVFCRAIAPRFVWLWCAVEGSEDALAVAWFEFGGALWVGVLQRSIEFFGGEFLRVLHFGGVRFASAARLR